MKRTTLLLTIFLVTILAITAVEATTTGVQVTTEKCAYGVNEAINIFGHVRTFDSDWATNYTYATGNATLTLYDGTCDDIGSALDTATATLSSGYFNSTAIAAPASAGDTCLVATYSSGNSTFDTGVDIKVISEDIDLLTILLSKRTYYEGGLITTTIKATAFNSTTGLDDGVADYTATANLRDSDGDSVASFSCDTNVDGECSGSFTAPSTTGAYYIDVNSLCLARTYVDVVPFDVEIYIKDDTGTDFKNIFAPSDDGTVWVSVNNNGSAANGTFTFSGTIRDASNNSQILATIASTTLNSNNSYTNKALFAVNASFSAGAYRAVITISQTGGGSVTRYAYFQVANWKLLFQKAEASSGFEYGYSGWADDTANFEIYPKELTNGTIITGLNGSTDFTVSLKNALGNELASATPVWDADCGSSGCYNFSLSLPSDVGSYILKVSTTSDEETHSALRRLSVISAVAKAKTMDVEGQMKALFGYSELIYINLSAKNKTSNVAVNDVEVDYVRYYDGTEQTYENATLGNVNASNTTVLNYAYTAANQTLVLEPLKTGGLYAVRIWINGKTAVSDTKFVINPYIVCTAPMSSDSSSNSENYYVWQYKTTDTVYFELKISEAQNDAGTTMAANETSGFAGGMHGMGSACQLDTSQKRAITNATINITKVVNMDSNVEITLNDTESTCKSSTSGTESSQTSDGVYVCTIQPTDDWPGGHYTVHFDVTGPDGEISDKSVAHFEARAFYLYGWASTWSNKPNATIGLTISMYEAGGSWWGGGGTDGGLSGSVSLEKIEYMGSSGEWIWPPIEYDYNVTGLNSSTITNGRGTMNLPASRTPDSEWKTGYYHAVLKGEDDDGNIDYGRAWFEVRQWYAYAEPVEVDTTNNQYNYKYAINTQDNLSLFVVIYKAGESSWGNSAAGKDLGGDVTIGIKKLKYSTDWPPTELDLDNYTYNTITVNESSRWPHGAAVGTYSDYIINISPNSGRWESGWYNLVLDINSTETGWGWFRAIAFYVNTEPVDSSGSAAWNIRNSDKLYFNVTATNDQNYWSWYGYQSSDYVNVSVANAELHRWNEATWQQVDYEYNTHFNITPTENITSETTLNFTWMNANNDSDNWPSGYYHGKLTLQNNDTVPEKETAWLWVSVKPFRVHIPYVYNAGRVGLTSNITRDLQAVDPDCWWGCSNQLINGTYQIVRVQQTDWSGYGRSVTNLQNYTPTASFVNNTSVTIAPTGLSGNKWPSGWNNIEVIVNNTDGNEERGWLYFEAVPFEVNVADPANYRIGTSYNVTVNVTLTAAGNSDQSAAGNLTSVFKWDWPTDTEYRFVTSDGCDSSTSGSCEVNGSANITVVAPSGGWDEGYYCLYTEWTPADDASSTYRPWDSICFNVRPAIVGYMYSSPDWRYLESENASMYVYYLKDLNGNTLNNVNITAVQYYKQEGSCWSDSCRTYTNATTSNTTVSQSQYIVFAPSSGNWSRGEYYSRVLISSGSDTGRIKYGWFRVVKSKTPPEITINAPTAGQTIATSTVAVNATTNVETRCNVWAYGSWNSTKYGNWGGYDNYLYDYEDWNAALTTSHTFSLTGAGDDNYTATVYCYDEDWNYNSTTVNFEVEVS